VVGDVDHDTVWTAAADLTRELGIEVNPTIRTAAEWEEDATGFAQQVKQGHRPRRDPLVVFGPRRRSCVCCWSSPSR
jgi:ABC-type sulfate transport system substrate-binding protein